MPMIVFVGLIVHRIEEISDATFKEGLLGN